MAKNKKRRHPTSSFVQMTCNNMTPIAYKNSKMIPYQANARQKREVTISKQSSVWFVFIEIILKNNKIQIFFFYDSIVSMGEAGFKDVSVEKALGNKKLYFKN